MIRGGTYNKLTKMIIPNVIQIIINVKGALKQNITNNIQRLPAPDLSFTSLQVIPSLSLVTAFIALIWISWNSCSLTATIY